MKTMIFRAECMHDVTAARVLLGARAKTWVLAPDDAMPDVVASFCVSDDITVEQVRTLFSENMDSHVMRQTLQLAELYTGERDYSL
jgi:uncharacterized membrane protein YkvA (DUF1232 family)